MGNTENMKASIAVMDEAELDTYITMLLTSPASSFWLQDALRASRKRDLVDMLNDVECLEAILVRRLQQLAQYTRPSLALSPVPVESREGEEIKTSHRAHQFFLDIMSTAYEGGINDWAAFRKVESIGLNYLTYDVRDNEDPSAPWMTITPEKIEVALKEIASPDCAIKIGDSYRYDIIQAYSTLDAGLIDAMLADIIVQVAAFGEIVFG